MAWYKRSLRFSVYILQKRAIWQQRNTMNIVGTGISNKNISAQFVVWIITLKICRCDDSNYGWYFTCGLVTVWIHQTKDLDKRRQILITSHATRQKYWNFSYFRIKIEDLKVLALRGRGEGWDVFSQGHWHISLPYCQQEDKLTLTASQNPDLFIKRFVTLKERQKSKCWCKQSRKGGEQKWKELK